METPAIEVTFAYINGHSIDDPATLDGEKWLEAFVSGATTIPGCRRAMWGTSDHPDYPIATHFIDYTVARLQRQHKKNDFKGLVSPPEMHHLIDPKTTDSVLITTNTSDRSIFFSPDVHIVTFWGIDSTKFEALAPEWFTSIAKSDACTGYIWGEVQDPVLNDPSGNANLGRGGIMISGWTSREEHDRDVNKPRVVQAYTALKDAVKKTETWGMHMTIVEDNGNVCKWRKVGSNQKPMVQPGAGYI